jgi:hypothetical protein
MTSPRRKATMDGDATVHRGLEENQDRVFIDSPPEGEGRLDNALNRENDA